MRLRVCPLYNDPRADVVTKLRARLSVGLRLLLDLLEENPDSWMQVLLQEHAEELSDDFRMSFRALSAAARAYIGAGASISLLTQFVAETKQTFRNVALDDRVRANISFPM